MGDEEAVFEVPSVLAALTERARSKGWPDDLLSRMMALRFPSWRIEQALAAEQFPTLEMIEGDVSDRERQTDGLCVREATWEDDERLSDLYVNADERIGDWTVIVERSPNPYAQQRLQENWHVKVLVDRGVALAVNAQSGRSSLIGGRELSVNWTGGWRVRNGFRRLGYSNLMINAPGSAASVFGMVSYWYVRLENGLATSWISRAVGDVQEVAQRPMDKLTATVHHLAADSGGERDLRVRPIRPGDLTRCVELINRTHGGLDLFRPYGIEFLRSRLDDLFWGPKPPFIPSVYGWDEMAVLEEEGEIVACGGLWDRGRDVREHWRHRETGEERLVDVTCLMDFGFADGRADAMAALIGHHLVTTSELGRRALCAPLEFTPDVLLELAWAKPEAETRALESMGFNMGDLRVESTMTRPYTDLAYW
jgi:hypothetical protein